MNNYTEVMCIRFCNLKGEHTRPDDPQFLLVISIFKNNEYLQKPHAKIFGRSRNKSVFGDVTFVENFSYKNENT